MVGVEAAVKPLDYCDSRNGREEEPADIYVVNTRASAVVCWRYLGGRHKSRSLDFLSDLQ